jgi:hypothetical protein
MTNQVIVAQPDDTICIGQSQSEMITEPQETIVNIQIPLDNRYIHVVRFFLIIDFWKLIFGISYSFLYLGDVIIALLCFSGLRDNKLWKLQVYGFYHIGESIFFISLLFLKKTHFDGIFNFVLYFIHIIYNIITFVFVRKYIKKQSLLLLV